MSDVPSEIKLKRVAGQSGSGWRWEGLAEEQQVTDRVNFSAAVSQDSRSKGDERERERGSEREGGETSVSERERETELI